MDDLKARVDQLADLMDQFQLGQAELSGDGWRVAFKKRAAKAASTADSVESETDEDAPAAASTPQAPAAPQGTPVNSPMTGIFYTSSSPSAAPFVREGEPISAGQVVGLIEAMKVFNEIVAPTSGRVTKVVATGGQLVNPGDPLLYIG
ncbi:MAG: acetyl-CoA carboxylase biotin carboxyl carrier protein [Fimbriimonadaceae bacterium]|jgi:biotin carboxyl carrier protein|nr:acetyl-CoA carboxylase biotin carboxyl carrier protein [Fimbriimonadaceae bacterium]